MLNAVEGFGKTTIGAYAPEPLIIMAPRETGYETLLSRGRVPEVGRVQVQSWDELLGMLRSLRDDPQGFRTIVLDAMNGLERLCHEHVCKRDYRNDWGPKGFMNWAKGPDTAQVDWKMMLDILDTIRLDHKIVILMLSHTIAKIQKNPLVEDFDRYIADVHHKTWGPTHKIADAVFFGTFHTIVDDSGGRPKGIGGSQRVIHTEHHDAYDAKNRFGMVDTVYLEGGPESAWKTLVAAMKGPK